MSGGSDRTAHDQELDSLRTGFFGGPVATYWLTRWALLRGLGLIYTVAFAILWLQGPGLIGSRGVLPARDFLARIATSTSLWDWPTLLWLDASDTVLRAVALSGLSLSLLVLLGLESGAVMLVLWALHLSVCHVGQVFWGYGWEILLLEAGFLAVWLAPWAGVISERGALPLRSTAAPSPIVIWLFRWLVFRVMFGAGLIKLRGDPCWTELSPELTCLAFHYETQPVPGPLSAFFHHAPGWTHSAGVLFNHFVELLVPFGVFGPRAVRHVAGALLIAFQVTLILSGNLSFLNWLTIVVCLACFDDSLLGRILPARMSQRRDALQAARRKGRGQTVAVALVAAVVVVLSYGPVANMLSRRQAMNTSFDNLHLVNSYGAFGSVSKVRHEVVLEGTRDASPGAGAHWQAYEFPCKPGAVDRRPCLVTPYHYRLDWQMWFAALGRIDGQPWLLHLVHRLLQGEPTVRALLSRDPFGKRPPRFIRGQLYEYHFTEPGSDAVWSRTRVGEYFRPLSLDDPALARFIESRSSR